MKKGDATIEDVYNILADEFTKNRTPVVDLIEVQTGDPFKVLIATILSARTKDEVTAAVSRKLFKRAANHHELKKLTEEEIRELIYPIGFYKTKARHLKLLPDVLDNEFGGKIPQDVETLTKLPGVGRKTANLVVAVAFKKPAVCVDVHVHRIFNRLGYVNTKTPLETEMELRKIFPQKFWTTFNSYFVSFGQHTCSPLRPKCNACPITKYCSKKEV
jgi:endonuclease III